MKGEILARRIMAVVLVSMGILALGCQEEEKKIPAKVYEPPKLRSEAERSATARTPVKDMDVRVTLKMTKDDVEEIQGKPESVDVVEYAGSREVVEKWQYPSVKNGCRQILFTDGKVTLLRNCVGRTNTKPKVE